VWFQHAQCDFDTKKSGFDTQDCDLDTQEYDFAAHEGGFNMRSVILTRIVKF
jgi:hypothetical protein